MRRVWTSRANPAVDTGCLIFVLIVIVIILVVAGLALLIPPLVGVVMGGDATV